MNDVGVLPSGKRIIVYHDQVPKGSRNVDCLRLLHSFHAHSRSDKFYGIVVKRNLCWGTSVSTQNSFRVVMILGVVGQVLEEWGTHGS